MKVILDLDHTSDWDDAQDLKIAAYMHRRGWIDLVAVGGCTSRTYLPAALEGALDYYGCGSVPVGTWKGAAYNQAIDYFNGAIAADQGVTTVASGYPDAVAVYRQQLAAAAAGSVTIVTTGPIHQISALLNSTADGYSALNGVDLCAAKVAQLVVVAGIWPTGIEYNLTEQPAPSDAVLSAWPPSVPLVFAGIELAGIVPGAGVVSGAGSVLGNLPSTEPCRRARDLHNAGLGEAVGHGRNAWGVMGLLYAAQGLGSFIAVRGTAAIDPSTGFNSWTTNLSGPHYYLRKRWSDAQYVSHVDSMLAVALTTSPSISHTWAGYGQTTIAFT